MKKTIVQRNENELNEKLKPFRSCFFDYNMLVCSVLFKK